MTTTSSLPAARRVSVLFSESRRISEPVRFSRARRRQEIFFRYYFVNASTGEKSGTMLAECKCTAAAAAGGEP